MFNSIKFRAALTVLIFLAALFYLTPTFVSELPDFWKEKLPKDKIHLGLDLQGGMHLVLEVDADKAVDSTLERLSNNLKESLMDNKIRFRNVDRTADKMITLELTDPAARESFEKTLGNNYPDLEIVNSETIEGREKVYLKMHVNRVAEVKKMAVDQSLETIRNRVDQFGISEPEIIPQGDDRILIQLPGIKDTKRAKNLIGKTALLEFNLVDDEHSLEDALKGNIPEGGEVAYGLQLERETGRQTSAPYLLKSKTWLAGEAREARRVKSATGSANPMWRLSSMPKDRMILTGLPPIMSRNAWPLSWTATFTPLRSSRSAYPAVRPKLQGLSQWRRPAIWLLSCAPVPCPPPLIFWKNGPSGRLSARIPSTREPGPALWRAF